MSGNTRILEMSSTVDTAKDPNKRSKISYAREFLLSLDKPEWIELPRDVRLSISEWFEEVSSLLPPPFCDPDSSLNKSVPQQCSLKVLDKINNSLHKSIEPYWPPHRYKELCESSGFPDSSSLKKKEGEKLQNDKVQLSKEDKSHVNKDTDFDESSEAFLMSPSSGNFSNSQSSSEITEQLDARHKPCLIQEAIKCNAHRLTIMPGTTKSCSTELQLLQDDLINNLKESEACSNLNVGHPNRIPDVMESLAKSRSPIFKKNHFEFEKVAKWEVLEDFVSSPLDDNELFLSTVDKHESAMVHCNDNLALLSDNQAISLSMKRNSPSSVGQILQDLDLNTFSKLEEDSNCSSDLCLPDEDSLIRFDEPFLKPDEQNSDVVDESVSGPEENPIKAGMNTPSSPRDMIVKLVEDILEDESSPAPHLVDPEVYHKSGLPAQPSHKQFCDHQLSPGWDQRVNNTVRRKSIDTTAYSSLTHHSFPSNTISQPFRLCHDKMPKFGHIGPPMFQQMTNPDPPYLCSFCGSLGGVGPDRSMQQKGSCTHKLNSMQGFPLGYQEPSHGSFTGPTPGSQTNGHSNQDRLWHPLWGGF